MLKKRIIPCLDIRNGQVTKGIEFKNNINLGDPAPLALRYAEQGADEIVIYDITASSEKRPPDFATLEKIARQVFIPICVGGGISSFQHAAQCIKSGAEKISLNSIAPKNPNSPRCLRLGSYCNSFGCRGAVCKQHKSRWKNCGIRFEPVAKNPHGSANSRDHFGRSGRNSTLSAGPTCGRRCCIGSEYSAQW